MTLLPDEQAIQQKWKRQAFFLPPQAGADIDWLLSHIETLRDENERLTQQIQDIAEELGCTEKTSHRHIHGRCIFTALETLRSQEGR